MRKYLVCGLLSVRFAAISLLERVRRQRCLATVFSLHTEQQDEFRR